MTLTSTTEVEVRYAETDQMGVVHHSAYLVWFELARTRLCRDAGYSYARIEQDGYFLVVSGADLKYREGARYGETLQVTARTDWVASRALQFGYEVRQGARLLAEGHTRHAWVDRATGRNCRLPAPLEPMFLELAGQDRLGRRSQASP
ncbi:MAG: thioesterase family protein [Acidobacteriota bacterium]|nr:thioesterase family protein [Acidobacteriota bacterium]